jgi:hypothetical protein
MTYYPMFTRGSSAQLPVVRKRIWRPLRSEAPGGSEAIAVNRSAVRIEWELRYEELTDAEAGMIESLFAESRGGLGSFCFIDPAANLLKDSFDLTSAAWQRDPMLVVTEQGREPGLDRVFRVSNQGQAPQGVRQALGVPASYTYCMSCWARGGTRSSIVLGVNGVERSFALGAEWRRCWVTAEAGGMGESVAFVISLPPGGAAEVCAPQAEAQPAPSGYRASGPMGAVFPEARFGSDELWTTTTGPNRNAVAVLVTSGAAE